MLPAGYNASNMVDAVERKAELAPEPGMDWAEFLANSPPDSTSEVSNLWVQTGNYYQVLEPDVFLYCDSEECDGPRKCQHCSATAYLEHGKWKFFFLTVKCRNCLKIRKTFALAALMKSSGVGVATKLGETPPFGPHTPARLVKMIGGDRELFLQGRRAENHGLGIGAFAYYRRVVENQKTRIIEQIAKVAAKLGAKPDILKDFEAAAKETQFSKAIDQIKHGIPDVLLIDGQHNPLTLLHTALSERLHAHTDEECLEIAQSIRVVLAELAERISQALKKEDELTEAVTRLLNRKSEKPTTKAPTGE